MKTNIIRYWQARTDKVRHCSETVFRRPGVYFRRFSFPLVLSCFFLMIVVHGRGQGSTDSPPVRNQFTIGLGASYIKTLDLLYSPIMYKSLRTDLHLGYLSKSKNGVFSTDLNVFLGALKPNSGGAVIVYASETAIDGVETTEDMRLEMSQIGFNLQLGYLHKLQKLQSPSKAFYLGASLEESLTYTPGFVNVGVINYGSVNARARFEYLLKNGKPVIFDITFPLVSVVTRLPYNQSPGEPGQSGLGAFFTGNNQVETLNHFQNARFSIQYPFLIKKRSAFNIRYEASWMHYYNPRHLTQAGNQLSLGFTF
ncbi:hypothetical protein [Dyadobacter sp. NIV53]|uniref:hypothetical protein n=1 Tax=Dyadobacter sp. NIV53 TaxID=2861765 RepID=UPI001C87B17B|nr:hypothetical protein [Dyadobacter sp. NIV53]